MHIPNLITTENLILRKFINKDKDRFIEFITDEKATEYLMFSQEQKTSVGAVQLLNFIINSYSSHNPLFSLAITLEDQGFIGSCGLSKIDTGIYECYYSLLRQFWGNGYATESMKGLIAYCFEYPDFQEIRAYVFPENPNSSRVAEKIGMNYSGISPHPIFKIEVKLYILKKSN